MIIMATIRQMLTRLLLLAKGHGNDNSGYTNLHQKSIKQIDRI